MQNGVVGEAEKGKFELSLEFEQMKRGIRYCR